MRHKPVIMRREHRVTFDENAIKTLQTRYPGDKLYPIIGDFRGYQKLLSAYIGVTQEDGTISGGMPVGKDGRIHTTYTHNPSTLRLASQNPNLQNLPRPGREDDLATLIRGLIIAGPGQILGARDFAGIEAVLVGYEAKDPSYIRLALRDIHSFYTAYCLHEIEGRLSANDLPHLSWDDAKLFTRLAEIKQEFRRERNDLFKHLIHAINFGQQAGGAQEKIYKETDRIFPTALITKAMGIYRELFPKIPKWQQEVRLQADRDGYLRNAFGYVHHFNHVFQFYKEAGQWQRKPGDDAERVLAFLPQSNAAGIIKEALLRLYQDRFEDAGQYLRLQVHDEILVECPEQAWTQVEDILREEMGKPVLQLPMPASWGLGDYLAINTESKAGPRWSQMI